MNPSINDAIMKLFGVTITNFHQHYCGCEMYDTNVCLEYNTILCEQKKHIIIIVIAIIIKTATMTILKTIMIITAKNLTKNQNNNNNDSENVSIDNIGPMLNILPGTDNNNDNIITIGPTKTNCIKLSYRCVFICKMTTHASVKGFRAFPMMQHTLGPNASEPFNFDAARFHWNDIEIPDLNYLQS